MQASRAWITALSFAHHPGVHPSSSWLALVVADADGGVSALEVGLARCSQLAQPGPSAAQVPAMGKLLTSRGPLLHANQLGAHALATCCVASPADSASPAGARMPWAQTPAWVAAPPGCHQQPQQQARCSAVCQPAVSAVSHLATAGMASTQVQPWLSGRLSCSGALQLVVAEAQNVGTLRVWHSAAFTPAQGLAAVPMGTLAQAQRGTLPLTALAWAFQQGAGAAPLLLSAGADCQIRAWRLAGEQVRPHAGLAGRVQGSAAGAELRCSCCKQGTCRPRAALGASAGLCSVAALNTQAGNSAPWPQLEPAGEECAHLPPCQPRTAVHGLATSASGLACAFLCLTFPPLDGSAHLQCASLLEHGHKPALVLDLL